MDDRHVAALHLQATRRFQTQQSAANDHRSRARARAWGARVASRFRNTYTPALPIPSMGGISGELPVARISLSNEVTLPSSPVTVLFAESTSTIRTPSRKSMRFLSYQPASFRMISSAVFSPARTEESRMRL